MPKATIPLNIIHGFKVAGIFPFNQDNFQESDFLASAVTDRPLSDTEIAEMDLSPTSQTGAIRI